MKISIKYHCLSVLFIAFLINGIEARCEELRTTDEYYWSGFKGNYDPLELTKPVVIKADNGNEFLYVLTSNNSIEVLDVSLSGAGKHIGRVQFPDALIQDSNFVSMDISSDFMSIYIADGSKGIWWVQKINSQWVKPVLIPDFLFDPENGIKGLNENYGIKVSNDGKWVVVVSRTGSVTVFNRNKQTGQLDVSREFSEYNIKTEFGVSPVDGAAVIEYTSDATAFFVCGESTLSEFTITDGEWSIDINASIPNERSSDVFRCDVNGMAFHPPTHTIYIADNRFSRLLVFQKANGQWFVAKSIYILSDIKSVKVTNDQVFVSSGLSVMRYDIDSNGQLANEQVFHSGNPQTDHPISDIDVSDYPDKVFFVSNQSDKIYLYIRQLSTDEPTTASQANQIIVNSIGMLLLGLCSIIFM